MKRSSSLVIGILGLIAFNLPFATAAPESISNIRLNKVEARPGDSLVVTTDITSPSGINWVNLILYPPSGGTKGFTTYFSLISGTEQNGTWSMSFTNSSSAESGVWNLVVGMQTKESLVKTSYGPSFTVSTEAEDFAAKAAADKAAAELKAKQEADAKAAAELKAKQEAELKAAAELKAKQEADAKATAELKAKQEAEAKAATDAKAAADKIIQDAKLEATRILAAANKKTTITCVKGKLTKKVTAVKPKCPSGYKKK